MQRYKIFSSLCVFVGNKTEKQALRFMMVKTKGDNSYSHILKYTGLFGGVQGLNILVGIVRNKLVAMILGPDGMGLVSLFNSTIKLVSDSTNLGLPISAVKNLSQAFDSGNADRLNHEIKIIRLWSLATAVLGLVVCLLLSPLLNKWTFSWGDHTLHFVLLSPVVALMAITGGETAILKATRRLRRLAEISVYNVLSALLISVPIYYFFGQAGIVPSLLLLAFAQCLLTIVCSFRLYPLRMEFSSKLFSEGGGMMRLGVAFVVAGILGSGAEFLVRTYLNNVGDLTSVGLYNAGFVMTMTYSGMVFSAMETDYFPRLSGIGSLGAELNRTVNHQVEVSLLLISPLLVFFLIGLPLLLPMLYSGKFMPVIGMMKFMVMAMYVRAMMLPIEYIPLSRGDSRSYLLLEAVYDVAFVACVVAGYCLYGLTGTGIGVLVAVVVSFIADVVYARWKYGYCLSKEVKLYAFVQIAIGCGALAVALLTDGVAYWSAGLLAALMSFAVSLKILHSKTHLWDKLKNRFCKHGKQ